MLSAYRYTMRLFFEIFSLQRAKFLDDLQQIEISIGPNGLPFQLFRHNETGSKFLFLDFSLFFENSLMSPKGPPSIC